MSSTSISKSVKIAKAQSRRSPVWKTRRPLRRFLSAGNIKHSKKSDLLYQKERNYRFGQILCSLAASLFSNEQNLGLAGLLNTLEKFSI